MLVKILVKNQLTFTNPITEGVTDEVRVQSEEPDSEKPAQRNLSGLFAFCK